MTSGMTSCMSFQADRIGNDVSNVPMVAYAAIGTRDVFPPRLAGFSQSAPVVE